MKPNRKLAETTTPDGLCLVLSEHDRAYCMEERAIPHFLAPGIFGAFYYISRKMRKRLASAIAGILVLGGLLAFTASANPLAGPTRTISGQTVNLLPLFHWWTNRAGARPLTAWVHVSGKLVGTNGGAWLLEAQVEKTEYSARAGTARATEGQLKILLRNPPLQEKAEFDRLRAQLNALNAEHAKLGQAQSTAQARAQVAAQEQKDYRRYHANSGALAQEQRRDKLIENQAKAELKPLDQQIQDLKKKLAAYPNPDYYAVDCFALETGQAWQQMPVFDHGFAFK